MRYGAMIVAAAVASLGVAAFPGDAKASYEVRLVQNWYARYLHRTPDPCGLENWVKHLRCGTPGEAVEGSILASAEYFHSHGCTPEGFVTGLYEDILGRRPCHREVCQWVNRLGGCGCRLTVAKEFLCAARRELTTPPAPAVYVPDFPPAPGYGYGPVPVRRVPMVEPPVPRLSVRVRVGR